MSPESLLKQTLIQQSLQEPSTGTEIQAFYLKELSKLNANQLASSFGLKLGEYANKISTAVAIDAAESIGKQRAKTIQKLREIDDKGSQLIQTAQKDLQEFVQKSKSESKLMAKLVQQTTKQDIRKAKDAMKAQIQQEQLRSEKAIQDLKQQILDVRKTTSTTLLLLKKTAVNRISSIKKDSKSKIKDIWDKSQSQIDKKAYENNQAIHKIQFETNRLMQDSRDSLHNFIDETNQQARSLITRSQSNAQLGTQKANDELSMILSKHL